MTGIIIYLIVVLYSIGLLASWAIADYNDYDKSYVMIIWPIVLVLLFFKYIVKAFKALPEIWKM
jgi:hypothetical protein